MNQRPQHARSGSQGRKVLPTHARPKPPPLTRRGTSYNSVHSRPHSSGKSNASAATRPPGSCCPEESDDDAMPGFDQFCATCERQIVTPGQVLYCSEACRRNDSSTQDAFVSSVPSPPLTPSLSVFDNGNYPHIDILPQRSPTVLRPLSQNFADLSLDLASFDSHNATTQHSGHRKSDSAQSLAEYYSSLSHSVVPRRPGARGSGDSGIPSLSNSPSSSYSTVASAASYQRPLPPRQYTSSTSTKSIDLVLPSHAAGPSGSLHLFKDASIKSDASTLTSFRVAEAATRSSRPTSPNEASPSQSLRRIQYQDCVGASPRS